jgi:general secretion pathway protein D
VKKTVQASILLLLIGFWFWACAANPNLQKGEKAFNLKNWDEAVEYYQKALQADPKNPRIKIALAKAYVFASNHHYDLGESLYEKGDKRLALIEFQKAIDIYPENQKAITKKNKILKESALAAEKTTEKTELERMKERLERTELTRDSISVDPDLRFDFNLRNSLLYDVVNALQKVGGINILLDEQVPNKPISVEFSNVSFIQALENLALSNTLYYKIIDERNIILIPDNPQKRQQYNELLVRTFYPAHIDIKELMNILKVIAKVDAISVNVTLNTITLRDTYGKVKIAEKILKAIDKPRGDVQIDIEIIEVNKKRMKEYGLDLSNFQLTAGVVSDSYPDELGLIRGDEFSQLTAANLLFSIPSMTYKLMSQDTESKIVANPQVRVKANEQAQVKIGDRVPIPITTFVPIAAGGVNQQPITSYQYENIGINIDVTPTIHYDSTISLKLTFELSFITSAGTPTLPPTIGNRSVTSIIRLKDGETNLLAGLLRDEERKSLRGIPGLVDIPVLRSLFGANSTEVSQSDIIFTITPRILSLPLITESDLSAFWVGSENNLVFKSIIPFEEDKEGVEAEIKGEKAKEDKKGEEEKGEPERIRLEMVKEKDSLLEKTPLDLGFLPPKSVVPENNDFLVEMHIDNMTDVREATMSVRYDPFVVHALRIDEDFSEIRDIEIIKKSIDNEKGTMLFSLKKGSGAVLSGAGIIFQIWFKPMKKGRTPLSFSEIRIQSHSGIRIPYRSWNGEIVIE